MSYPAKYDAIGVGIGPFNLSAAALCAPIADLKTVFLDSKREFSWHPGLLVSGATIQTSHLKDLVTLADPTSRYSFLSYLHAHRRMYRFITAGFEGVQRVEFDDYFRWVSKKLGNTRFGTEVHSVEHAGDSFTVNGNPELTTRNLILGTGLRPNVPKLAEGLLGDTIFHASSLMTRNVDWTGRRVAIIGGGQSGGEVLNQLISDEDKLPSKLYWISRRDNFLPLDDSPFTNELFTPGYSNFFFDLPVEKRLFSVQSQKLSSDGISSTLLQQIYRRLYAFEFFRGRKPEIVLRPNTNVVGLERDAQDQCHITIKSRLTDKATTAEVDLVILCTGYRYSVPRFLERMLHRIQLSENGYEYNPDFSIKWDGPPDQKIYVQNAAVNSRGIADPNLSLMAWRSANIVNGLAGRAVYQVHDSKDLDLWL